MAQPKGRMMKRYQHLQGGESNLHPTGTWVMYLDVEAEIKRLEAIVAPLPTDSLGDPIVLGATYLANGKPFTVETIINDGSVRGGDPPGVGNDMWYEEANCLIPMPEEDDDELDG